MRRRRRLTQVDRRRTGLGVELPRKFNPRAFWRRQNRVKIFHSVAGARPLFVNGVVQPSGNGTSKAEMLFVARQATKNPRLTWKGAKKWEKRQKVRGGK
jgi:hypothetical protein